MGGISDSKEYSGGCVAVLYPAQIPGLWTRKKRMGYKAAVGDSSLTASITKIHLHPGKPCFPFNVLYTPACITPEIKVPPAVAAWNIFDRLPSSSLVYHDPIKKTDHANSAFHPFLVYAVRGKRWTYGDPDSIHFRIVPLGIESQRVDANF
jgi:hypothetical protein